MTDLVLKVRDISKTFLKDFLSDFNKLYGFDVNTFLRITNERLQIYPIYYYLVYKFGISFYYDSYSYMIYYSDVEKHKEEIINLSKYTNNLSHVLKYEHDLDKLDDVEAFKRALFATLKILYPELTF